MLAPQSALLYEARAARTGGTPVQDQSLRLGACYRDLVTTRSSAFSALLLVSVLIAAPGAQNAPAQRGGTAPSQTAKLPARWWKDPAITEAVGLTRVQADRIDTVFEEFLKPQRERWNVFRPLERELDELLREPHPDEKQVLELITNLEDRRSELNRNRMIMLFHIQQVLSVSQRAKLEELGWATPTRTPQPNQQIGR